MAGWGGAVYPVREGVPARVLRRVAPPDPFRQVRKSWPLTPTCTPLPSTLMSLRCAHLHHGLICLNDSDQNGASSAQLDGRALTTASSQNSVDESSLSSAPLPPSLKWSL